MQVRCVRAFGRSVPGDVAEVPEGATVDPVHWEPVTADPPPPAAPVLPAAPLSAADVIGALREGM